MEITKKPILFAVLALGTVLVGTVATMAYPMLRPDMHPHLQNLRAFTPLELAGRDIYQREGCSNCHTQTVRPLGSEVQRYGEYSKAGEFALDHPFLWGSKRTGPDLAREGGKRPDGWHLKHFVRPQDFEPKSNMPAYAFLATSRLDVRDVRTDYLTLAKLAPGLSATEADFTALDGKTELDALVAYMQWLGHAVARAGTAIEVRLDTPNPLVGNAEATARGAKVFADNCAACHGDDLNGVPDLAPSLVDKKFLGDDDDATDGGMFILISGGSDAKKQLGKKGLATGGMTAFGGQLKTDDIWGVINYIRAEQAKHK